MGDCRRPGGAAALPVGALEAIALEAWLALHGRAFEAVEVRFDAARERRQRFLCRPRRGLGQEKRRREKKRKGDKKRLGHRGLRLDPRGE